MAEATQVTCTDKKCPTHGSLNVRGATFIGKVVSAKERHSAVVGVDYARKVRKYERLEKRRSKLHVHIPHCMSVKEGDTVEVGECRRLSKTKAHVITKILLTV